MQRNCKYQYISFTLSSEESETNRWNSAKRKQNSEVPFFPSSYLALHPFHGVLGFLLTGIRQESEASRPLRYSFHHKINCSSTRQNQIKPKNFLNQSSVLRFLCHGIDLLHLQWADQTSRTRSVGSPRSYGTTDLLVEGRSPGNQQKSGTAMSDCFKICAEEHGEICVAKSSRGGGRRERVEIRYQPLTYSLEAAPWEALGGGWLRAAAAVGRRRWLQDTPEEATGRSGCEDEGEAARETLMVLGGAATGMTAARAPAIAPARRGWYPDGFSLSGVVFAFSDRVRVGGFLPPKRNRILNVSNFHCRHEKFRNRYQHYFLHETDQLQSRSNIHDLIDLKPSLYIQSQLISSTHWMLCFYLQHYWSC